HLVNLLPVLEEIHSLFQLCRTEMEKTQSQLGGEVEGHAKEMNQLITLLKRNRDLEEARITKIRERGIEAVVETIATPELYADLEQKTLGLLLKSSYLTERIRVLERKKEPQMATKGAQRNVLDLLEQRENELAALRKKYEQTRKNSFLGLVEKESSIEIEHELNQLARALDSKTSLMKKSFEESLETFSEFKRHMQDTQEKIGSVEELEAQITGKMFELITMLKKERDYVKRVLIDIEQETIQLRNTYSRELLGLQEEKMGIKNSLEEKYDARIRELKQELADKNHLLKKVHESISHKEKKIAELEEHNEKLSLAKKALERHGEIKKQFLGKEKSPRPKKHKSGKN
ncbi:MAG: hypothetical protein NUV67_03550, partial [archaeon]|nr:hypothetical protein [archaeon]